MSKPDTQADRERRQKIDQRLDRENGKDVGEGGSWGFLNRRRKYLRENGYDDSTFYDGFIKTE